MSSSFNQSSSSSATFPIETAENGIMDQIASVASGMAQNLYQWAGQTFQQTSQITNQAVGNFFQTSSNMLGLSKNLTDQYNNLFAPENAQLVADANSYASPARMATDMGMAGATQAQAGNAALDNSEEALRAYGINPSDGRYAALDQAARVQNAANVAGAENMQRVSDIATGQKLRSDAVAVGAQLPAAISNVNNTAIQANTGASNAELANANTGANLYGLADKYLGTAMSLKLPFSGSQGSSQSSGSSSSPSKGGGNGGGGSGGGSGGGTAPGGGGTSWSGMTPNTSAMGSDGGRGTMGQPGSSITHINDNDPRQPQPGGPEGGGPEGGDPTDQTDGGMWSGYGGPNDPWGGGQLPGQPDNSGIDQGPWGGGYTDPGGGAIPQDWQDPQPQTDPGSFGPPPDTGGDGGGDGGGFDYSSYSGDGGDYGFARGGSVPHMHRLSSKHLAPSYAAGGEIPAAGHQVPPSMSPSHGQRVDDVPARGPGGAQMHLNAREFVVPEDVARWKGEEFFQKLINQSRMARHGAPAKPTMGVTHGS